MNDSKPNKVDFFTEARQLMDEHGLQDWNLRWMARVSTTTCGRCFGGKKKQLEFNRQYVIMTGRDKPEEAPKILRNTILHEIAHALDNKRRGYSAHDKKFREICAEIGCDGKTKCSDAVLPKRAGLYKVGVSIIED